MRARQAILTRVGEALADRARVEHPGAFRGGRPLPLPTDPVDGFAAMFGAAGGEVALCAGSMHAAAWLEAFAADFDAVAVGATVPPVWVPDRPQAPPETAPLSVSVARGAVAETGSLLLDARDGRRTQLLAPTHVVLVRASAVHATLAGALAALRDDLPSAVGLHAGPSKSADIGQILVKGVHGPGRVVAVVVGDTPVDSTSSPDADAAAVAGDRATPGDGVGGSA